MLSPVFSMVMNENPRLSSFAITPFTSCLPTSEKKFSRDLLLNVSFTSLRRSLISGPYAVYGGAIALGHPLGCTGSKLTATLLHEMKRRDVRYGIVTMCIGGGMGAAGLFERVA